MFNNRIIPVVVVFGYYIVYFFFEFNEGSLVPSTNRSMAKISVRGATHSAQRLATIRDKELRVECRGEGSVGSVWGHGCPPWKQPKHLKMDGWKMTCPFGMAYFQGRTVSFREDIYIYSIHIFFWGGGGLWLRMDVACVKIGRVFESKSRVVDATIG